MAEKYILKNRRAKASQEKNEYIVFNEDMVIRRRLDMTQDEAKNLAGELGLISVSPLQAFNASTREAFLQGQING